MKIDLKTLKSITRAFLESEGPRTDFRQLAKAVDEVDDEGLIAYVDLLYDDGYVILNSREPGIGVVWSTDGVATISINPLRLTASGQRFAIEMQKPGALKWIEKFAKGVPVTLSLVSDALSAWASGGYPLLE